MNAAPEGAISEELLSMVRDHLRNFPGWGAVRDVLQDLVAARLLADWLPSEDCAAAERRWAVLAGEAEVPASWTLARIDPPRRPESSDQPSSGRS